MFATSCHVPCPTCVRRADSAQASRNVFDGLGDLLIPTMTPTTQMPSSLTGGNHAGAVKGMGSDLDSSLASLVGNLGISGTTVKKGDLQWSGGEKKLTGGANWQPKVAPATWASGGTSSAPMQGSAPTASGGPPSSSAAAGTQPGPGFALSSSGSGVPMMPQQPMMYGQSMIRPPFGTSAPLSPSPASQSPKKPPTKDPLADLNIKDFL